MITRGGRPGGRSLPGMTQRPRWTAPPPSSRLSPAPRAPCPQVVGHVIHISSGGAQTSLGRKIGQGFAMPGPVLAGGVGGPLAAVLDQLDAPVGQLFAQMHQARAAMMRAMADDFALLNQRLPAPLFGALPAPAGDELPPFQPRPAPGHIMGWGRRQGLLGEEGAEGRAPCRHGHSHHPMMVMGRLWGGEPRGGDALPPFNPDWAALEVRAWGWALARWWLAPPVPRRALAVGRCKPGGVGPCRLHPPPAHSPAPRHPALQEPPMVESPRWTFVAADGSTNWGFVLFLVLSAACAGVWAAGIAAYCSYVRAMRAAEGCCPARRRAQFVTSKGSAGLLSPLLPEGPLESPKLYTGGCARAGAGAGGPGLAPGSARQERVAGVRGAERPGSMRSPKNR